MTERAEKENTPVPAWPEGFTPLSDEEMEEELSRWMKEDAERRANTPVDTQVQWFFPYYEATFSKFNGDDSEVPAMMKAAYEWMEKQPTDTIFGHVSLKHGEPSGKYVSVMFSPHIEPSLGLFVAAFHDTERLLAAVEKGDGNGEDFLRWMKSHMESYRWRMERQPADG